MLDDVIHMSQPRYAADPALAVHIPRITDTLSVEVDNAVLREREVH